MIEMKLTELVVLANSNVPDDLPTLNVVENWGLTVILQLISLLVFFMVAKHFARFKFGGIVMTMILGGVVTFVVQNWSRVSAWVQAFIDTF